MTDDEKRRAIGSLLRALPDALTTMQIARTLHQSKNRIYEKMRGGELPGEGVSLRHTIRKELPRFQSGAVVSIRGRETLPLEAVFYPFLKYTLFINTVSSDVIS